MTRATGVTPEAMTYDNAVRLRAPNLEMHREGYKEALIHRFETHTAPVAVIGLGDVGLPLAVRFAQAGFRVTGIDLGTRKDVSSVMVADIRGCFGSGELLQSPGYRLVDWSPFFGYNAPCMHRDRCDWRIGCHHRPGLSGHFLPSLAPRTRFCDERCSACP